MEKTWQRAESLPGAARLLHSLLCSYHAHLHRVPEGFGRKTSRGGGRGMTKRRREALSHPHPCTLTPKAVPGVGALPKHQAWLLLDKVQASCPKKHPVLPRHAPFHPRNWVQLWPEPLFREGAKGSCLVWGFF